MSSVYRICVAQTFDRLERKHYVAATGGLLLLYALGATAGSHAGEPGDSTRVAAA